MKQINIGCAGVNAKRRPALVIAELEGDDFFSFLRNGKVKNRMSKSFLKRRCYANINVL
jgi:hypothetical protein